MEGSFTTLNKLFLWENCLSLNESTTQRLIFNILALKPSFWIDLFLVYTEKNAVL